MDLSIISIYLFVHQHHSIVIVRLCLTSYEVLRILLRRFRHWGRHKKDLSDFSTFTRLLITFVVGKGFPY